ncbi:YqaA family protein [Halomicrobium urmianum]|uniref:YqaA family protein n=1 Tax=Halomicrobium urmianum TaxID=1586233 RepID=UPI001CDA2153|nr:VTT domain-containing protein [Halomicrobium urmianum]
MQPFSIDSTINVSREFFVSLGAPGLVVLGFLEFFFFPLPPMFVVIPLAVAHPEMAVVYALSAATGSVIAGVVGFTIGRTGGRPVVTSRFPERRVDQAERYVDEHGFATVAFGAFAPIPEAHELLSIGSGAFGMRLRTYLGAAALGRGAKYFIVAGLGVALGRTARSLSEAEVYSVIGVVVVVVVLAYVSRDYWIPRPTW